MFYAISKKYNDVVCASNVTDLNDIFLCLNSQCKAEYFIKGINSERKAHFCHKHSTPHIQGCPYDMGLTKYLNNDDIVKSSLQDIYAHIRKPIKKAPTIHVNKQPKQNASRKTYINTTKDLFYFCTTNSLDTIYENKTTINDIIVDSRNICSKGLFKGFSSLRLVVGYTIKYDFPKRFILLKTEAVTKYGKTIDLYSTIYMETNQIKEIKDYLFGTFGTFTGYPVAVLGKWSNSRLFNIECTINEPTNVIYKFANDIDKR